MFSFFLLLCSLLYFYFIIFPIFFQHFVFFNFRFIALYIMSSNQQQQQTKQRIQVPDVLRDVLLEFSIAYLLEQPGDVIDYAVEYFTKLQQNRNQQQTESRHTQEATTPDDESVDEGKNFYDL